LKNRYRVVVLATATATLIIHQVSSMHPFFIVRLPVSGKSHRGATSGEAKNSNHERNQRPDKHATSSEKLLDYSVLQYPSQIYSIGFSTLLEMIEACVLKPGFRS
jgi:hypothetical protein